MKTMQRFFALLLAIMFLQSGLANAEDDKEYAKAALNGLKTNHYARYLSIPFETYFNLDYGKDGTQSILYFKPVVPFHISNNYDLIIRTIAPIYERTPTSAAHDGLNNKYINGWGDINPTFFLTPARFDKWIVGIGPTLSIPTSSNNRYIGTGKWSLGPELAVYHFSDNWVIGCLTYNMWSVAGDAERPAVNSFQFQYLVSYLFPKGWYLSTNPTITANWKSAANQQWVVPFGIGGGRAFKLDQQPINMGVYGYYNAIRPAKLGPNWQIQLEVEWLLNPQ